MTVETLKLRLAGGVERGGAAEIIREPTTLDEETTLVRLASESPAGVVLLFDVNKIVCGKAHARLVRAVLLVEIVLDADEHKLRAKTRAREPSVLGAASWGCKLAIDPTAAVVEVFEVQSYDTHRFTSFEFEVLSAGACSAIWGVEVRLHFQSDGKIVRVLARGGVHGRVGVLGDGVRTVVVAITSGRCRGGAGLVGTRSRGADLSLSHALSNTLHGPLIGRSNSGRGLLLWLSNGLRGGGADGATDSLGEIR